MFLDEDLQSSSDPESLMCSLPEAMEEGSSAAEYEPQCSASDPQAQQDQAALYSGMYDDDDKEKTAQPAAGMAKPPRMRGNCTDEQWYPLNLAVKNECKINMPSKCVESDSPEVMEGKAAHYQRCIDAREALMETCFDGGDDGHSTQIEQLENGRDNCGDLLKRVTEPAPEKAPEVKPEGEGGKSIRERVGEITGLTGTALTIYLIVSEGSRLFPPRNALPIP